MKHLFIAVITFLIFTSTSVYAHVRLNAPVDGATMIVNGTITISWQIVQEHDQNNWDLYFSSDGGANWDEIQIDMAKTQLSLNWTVPNIETTQAMIKIIQDNNGMNYEDICEAFTITTGSYTHAKMLSPISGIELTPTEITNISWEMFQTTGLVNWDLYLSTDDGASWTELQLDIDANTLYYKWTIPDVATTTAKIKVVYDNSGTDQEAVSEAFTILGTTTSIEIKDGQKELLSNYPNPFSSRTNFVINLKTKTNVLLEVYALNGLKISTVLNKEMTQGEHLIPWHSNNYSSGVYFCKIQAGNELVTSKLVVLE